MSVNADGVCRETILLVEDNERNARLVGEILRGNGYSVGIARNGLQAVYLARSLRPALILMDLQLPKMDGLTATRTLKSDVQTAQIPIIALTAHAMPEHRECLLEAGCCSYITKPISYRPFLEEIKRTLAQRVT